MIRGEGYGKKGGREGENGPAGEETVVPRVDADDPTFVAAQTRDLALSAATSCSTTSGEGSYILRREGVRVWFPRTWTGDRGEVGWRTKTLIRLSSEAVMRREEVKEMDRMGVEWAGKVETREPVEASKSVTYPVSLATARSLPSGLYRPTKVGQIRKTWC